MVDTAAWVACGLEGVHNGEGVAVFGAFGGETTSVLDIDDLAAWVKFVNEEVEELVEELSHSFGVSASFLGHIELLNDLEVTFEEGVSLGQAIDLLRGILWFARVPCSASLAFKEIVGEWIVY